MTLDLILFIGYIPKFFIAFDIAPHIFVFRAVVESQIMVLPTSFNICILKNVTLRHLDVQEYKYAHVSFD